MDLPYKKTRNQSNITRLMKNDLVLTILIIFIITRRATRNRKIKTVFSCLDFQKFNEIIIFFVSSSVGIRIRNNLCNLFFIFRLRQYLSILTLRSLKWDKMQNILRKGKLKGDEKGSRLSREGSNSIGKHNRKAKLRRKESHTITKQWHWFARFGVKCGRLLKQLALSPPLTSLDAPFQFQ